MKKNIKQKLKCNKCSQQIALGQEITVTWGETKSATASGICSRCSHYVSLYCPRETVESYSAKYCHSCFKEHEWENTKRSVIVFLSGVFVILVFFAFFHYSEKRSAAKRAQKITYIASLEAEVRENRQALADYELQVQELEERLANEPNYCSNCNPCLKDWKEF